MATLVKTPAGTWKAMIRKPNPGAGRSRRLSADEQRRLLATVDVHSNPMLGWIVCIAIETGMRRSEIMNLQCGQVDLVRRVARLPQSSLGTVYAIVAVSVGGKGLHNISVKFS